MVINSEASVFSSVTSKKKDVMNISEMKATLNTSLEKAPCLGKGISGQGILVMLVLIIYDWGINRFYKTNYIPGHVTRIHTYG